MHTSKYNPIIDEPGLFSLSGPGVGETAPPITASAFHGMAAKRAPRILVSFRQLPEFAGFDPVVQSTLWNGFLEENMDVVTASRVSQPVLTGGFMAGIVAGWVATNTATASVAGGIAGTIVTLLLLHIWLLHGCRERLQKYIRSSPISPPSPQERDPRSAAPNR